MPQWNCACANCVAAHSGKIPSQTQSSVAIGVENNRWFLINASPDLTRQIETTPELQPNSGTPRNSPIGGVLLTNGDIDHALGLVLMRQQDTPLIVYATDETRGALNWIDNLVDRFCRIDWRPLAPSKPDSISGTAFSAIALQQSVAIQLRDELSGKVAVIAPAVGELTDELREAIDGSDLMLFDGTFWSDDELRAVRPNARSAREMGHLPIKNGSLDYLRQSPARRKIYTHINNTNPILMPGSPERTLVQEAGIEIAADGLEIVL